MLRSPAHLFLVDRSKIKSGGAGLRIYMYMSTYMYIYRSVIRSPDNS